MVFTLACAATAVAARAPGDPREAFNARDSRWAKQIVLEQADLPTGVKWIGIGTGGPDTSGGGAGPACPGVANDDSDLTMTGRASSPFFLDKSRVYSIASFAWIFRSAVEARTFVARLTGGLAKCGPDAMKAEVGATKGTRLLSFGELRLHGVTSRWVAFRVLLSVPDGGRRVKSYVDLVFGDRGAATASLLLHGAFQPIPAGVEASIIRLVDSRMAH